MKYVIICLIALCLLSSCTSHEEEIQFCNYKVKDMRGISSIRQARIGYAADDTVILGVYQNSFAQDFYVIQTVLK